MSPRRHGVVVLAGSDDEGPLVQAIDARGQHLVVIRRCADLAEVRAAARAGVAELAALDAADPDLDRSVLEDLHASGMAVVLLAPLDEAARLRSVGADAVAQAAAPDGVVESLLALARDLDERRDQEGRAPERGPRAAPPPWVPESPAPPSPMPPGTPAPPSSMPGTLPPDPWTTPAVSTALPAERPGGPGSAREDRGPSSPAGSVLPGTDRPARPGTGTPTPAGRPSAGRVLAVWGTSGAPGRTTIAVNIAAALAGPASPRPPSIGEEAVLRRAGRDERVVLVDADTAAPSVAHLLGLPADTPGVGVLARQTSRGRLDPSDVARAAVRAAPGLSVLTGLSAPQRWRELGPAALTEILRVARAAADLAVVDVASASLDPVDAAVRHQGSRDELVAAALRASDIVVAVARGDALGLARLAQSLAWWEELGVGAELRIVVNQVSRDSAGPRPVNAVAAALAEVLPGRTIRIVPQDAHVAAALLAGRPVVSTAPTSEAGAALIELALSLAGAPSSPQRAGRRGRRRGRPAVGD